MTENRISIENLSFTYPTLKEPTLIIDELKIKKSEKVFIYGPSGCGKTTLLELLAGVLVPDKGQITMLGKSFLQMTSAQRDSFRGAHIGYIFQNFNLIPYLSVEENIQLPLFLSKIRQQKLESVSVQSEVYRMCEHLGIIDFLSKKVIELSVGQQQRVAVARALLGRPEVILADEPTSALDYGHKEKFIELLFKTCEEINSTVLFVSHDKTLMPLFPRSISLVEINKVLQK